MRSQSQFGDRNNWRPTGLSITDLVLVDQAVMVPSMNRATRLKGVACAVALSTLFASQAAAGEPAQDRNHQQGEAATVQSPADEGVANLPFARGRTVRALDDYLAHLEKQGAIDLPWWREIRPGVYERVTSMRGAEREIATREELMRRFGFTR
jgi:hypothetical protein